MFHSVLLVFVFSSSALSARKKISLATAEENEGVSLKGVEVLVERKVSCSCRVSKSDFSATKG
jgi:hypothetical protein